MNKLIFKIISATLILAGLINLGLYFNKSNSDIGHYEDQITVAAEALKASLNNFFEQTQKTIFGFNQAIEQKDFDSLSKHELDQLANTYIAGDPYIKGLVLFSGNSNYVFLKDKNTRITTFADNADSLLNWQRLDKNLKPVSEWTDTYNFFLNNENKALLQSISKEGAKQKWLKIKSEIPDRRDMVLLVNYVRTKNNKDLFITYIFQTKDFAGFFLDKLKAKHPVVSFLTNEDKILTPIVTQDTVYVNKIKMEEEQISKIFKTWDARDKFAHSFSFEMNGHVYWTRVESIPNKLGIKAFALTFSQESLYEMFTSLNRTLLYLGFGLMAAGLALLLFLKFKGKRTKNTKTEEKPEPLSKEEIEKMLAAGESGSVEYKSSLRYDYRQEKENKALEDVILKSIAAFANAQGGVLFIGVDDEGNILGLENDFSTLKKKDIDYFELHLRKLINNQFGIHFASRHLTIRFPEIEGKIISVVQINPSGKPVYVKVKNKQGQWVEKFYVRMGNSSQEITSLKEMEEYIEHRFRK